MVEFYNSCPECFSQDITHRFLKLDGGKVVDLRTKKAVNKDDLDFRIHENALYCKCCHYYDFPDAFRERKLTVNDPEFDDVYGILRLQYVNYLRKKYSLLNSHEVYSNDVYLNGVKGRKEG
jgi:hypothetical protein